MLTAVRRSCAFSCRSCSSTYSFLRRLANHLS